jgi:small GTP-binding protein
MVKDLEIIKQIEEEIRDKGKKEKEWKLIRFKPNIIGGSLGYSSDENGNVYGLNLNSVNYKEIILDFPFLKNLTNLTQLDLKNNQISDISFLQNLTKLIQLDLKNNQISDISSLKDLKNLTELNLGNNQISDTSDISSLEGLKNLKRLDLKNNKISKLPPGIIDLNMEIKWIDDYSEGIIVDGNPLKNPPVEIEKKGGDAVRAYLKSLLGKKKTLNEAKVLFVGDGGAGKTSMVKRLQGEDFDLGEPPTHGINIKHKEVMAKKGKIKAHFWDFGGQQIMHAIHEFFLSKRCLYVLILDGRRFEKIEDWLRYVYNFGGDSPVLVVINKIDVNPTYDVNRLFLKNKYKNIKGFFRVSCATKEGIQDFTKALTGELQKLELVRTTWGESWFNIKTQLEETTKDFITFSEYKTICEKEKITGIMSQATILDYLNDLGALLHFKDFYLQDTHVLNPEWVAAAVYKIITSKKVADSKGRLKLKLLDEILKKERETDYCYPPDKYRYIIDLMQKFKLCYYLDSDTILIPDLMEIQEPYFDFEYSNALEYVIDYKFFPRSIIPRFIVKMHKDIKDGLHWRTGVVLENEAFHSNAVVKSDNEEKRISIYVQGVQKKDYFAAILYTFREINKSFVKLGAIEKITMPEEPDITERTEHLIRLSQNDKTYYYYPPDGSEVDYSIDPLIAKIYKNPLSPRLDEFKNEYNAMSKLESQERGYEFERFLYRLFDLFDLKPRGSFKITGEQIDLSFEMPPFFFLLEAKWQKEKIGSNDLYTLFGKVSGRDILTRGLFISISEFSKPGLEAFKSGRPTSIICMDGKDLLYILDGKLTLPEAISLKLRIAADENESYYPLGKLIQRYPKKRTGNI